MRRSINGSNMSYFHLPPGLEIVLIRLEFQTLCNLH